MPETTEDSSPQTLCVLPWINMHVATTGAISPCCEFDGEYANLSSQTMQEAWHGTKLNSIRKAFLDGVPLSECRKCIDREANEGRSFRLESNERHSKSLSEIGATSVPTAFPIALDLRFSNLCNFKCRSCWHGASSKWFTDAKAIGLNVSDRAEISSFRSVEDFLIQVLPGIDQIEEIYFAGGEPLLLSEHYALLDRLIEIGRTDLSLRYNSNMSVLTLKNRSILDLWARFPNIEVSASVDATGTLGANMRSGFDWEVFVANVKEVREKCGHIKLLFGVTVSAMNITSLPTLFDALERECGARLDEFFVHSLQDPVFYRTQVLPKEVKKKSIQNLEKYIKELWLRHDLDHQKIQNFIDSLQGLINYMMAQKLRSELPKFLKRTLDVDALRQERSADVLPMLRNHLEKRKSIIPSLSRLFYG